METRKIICIGPLPDAVAAEFAPEYMTYCLSDSSRQEVLAATDESVSAIIARGSVLVDKEIMDRARQLKVIARSGVGYDTVNIPDATARNIPVVYTPGAMSRAVAEHTLGFILTALKNFSGWKAALLEGSWHRRYQDFSDDLENAVIGIVGYGRIGRQVRRLLRNFDVKILANDPYINHSDFASDQVEFVEFIDVLENSNIVTLHVPLTHETRGMICRNHISRLKPGAVLINTARGAVVENLDLLYEHLESRCLSAVGLDVFPQEPPDTTHPIFRHPRAFLTPHVAARTPAATARILGTVATEVKKVLSGKKPNLENVVNPEIFNSED